MSSTAVNAVCAMCDKERCGDKLRREREKMRRDKRWSNKEEEIDN